MKISVMVVLLSIIIVCCIHPLSSASTIEPKTHVFGNFGTTQLQNKLFSFSLDQQTGDSMRVYSSESLKLKNPKMAVVYSVVPGFVVHGSGHFYAGETKTGFLLLGAEVVGAYLVFGGVFSGLAEEEYDPNLELWGFAGIVLFAGSWVYDIVRSPQIVKKQNKELLDRKQSLLRFRTKDGSLRLEFVRRF